MDIAGYKIQHKLGEGAMASVYLAVQQSLDRPVALKVLKPALVCQSGFTQRFFNEGKIVAHLNHPGIVSVHDLGVQPPNYYYMAMEFLSGGTLRHKIKSGLSTSQSLQYIKQICTALDFAHQHGVIHRDIKSQNIMFRDNDIPILTDFGIARLADSDLQLTNPGRTLGSPLYMSPEQISGQKIDARSDLYSVGILFYEMLTNELPFYADQITAVALMHKVDPIPILPDQLSMFQPVLAKLLAKDPDHRYSSAQELIEALSPINPDDVVPSQDSGKTGLDSRHLSTPPPVKKVHIDAASRSRLTGDATLPAMEAAQGKGPASSAAHGTDGAQNDRDQQRLKTDAMASAPDKKRGGWKMGLVLAAVIVALAAGLYGIVQWNVGSFAPLDRPSPIAPPDNRSVEEQKIAALLAKAKSQLMRNYLMSPVGDNYRETYQQLFMGRHRTLESVEALVSLLGGPDDKRALPLLVSYLSHESQWVRMFICETIGTLGGDEAVAALLNAAKTDGQILVRQAAVYALRRELFVNPEGSVIPALLEIMKIPELADDASRTLRKLRKKNAVEKLYPALSYENSKARKLVCDIIRYRRHSKSTDKLLSLLKREKDNQVVDAAILSLAYVHPPQRQAEVFAVLTGFLKDAQTTLRAIQAIDITLSRNKQIDKQAAVTLGDALLVALASDNNSVRRGAAGLLGDLSYPKASPILMGLIQKEAKGYVRDTALRALGNCVQNEQQVRFLFDWGRKHPDDSQAVSDALDRISSPAYIKPFIDELYKNDNLFIRNSIDAFGRMKDPDAAKPLLDLIEKGSPLKLSAANVLTVVARKDDLPRIMELLIKKTSFGSSNHELINSFVTLDRLNGFGQLKILLKRGGEKEQVVLMNVFSRWRVIPSDARILIEALAVEDKHVKRFIVMPLSRIDSIESREALCRLLHNEPDKFVREAVGKNLGDFADTRTVQCMITAYKAVLADKNAILLKEAIQSGLYMATGRMFDDAQQAQAWFDQAFEEDKGIGERIKLLNHQDEKIRLLAARDISRWPDRDEQHKALVPIMGLMEKGGKPFEEIEWIRALGRIGDPCVIGILEKKLDESQDLKQISVIAKALMDLKSQKGIARLINCLTPVNGYRAYDQKEAIEALAMITGQPLKYDADQWQKWWAKLNNDT